MEPDDRKARLTQQVVIVVMKAAPTGFPILTAHGRFIPGIRRIVEARRRAVSALAPLLLLMAALAHGQFFPGRLDPRWRTVGVGAAAARPVTCTGNRDVYICNGAGCGTNGGYYYCTATDTWSSLIGGGGSSGITSLGGQIGSAQTFSKVDDTNVTLTITSATDNHQFLIGWTAALAKSRQHSSTVYLDATNTYLSGDQDMSAANSWTAPVAAGAAPTANGRLAYDSTANDLEYGDNGTNRKVANLDEAQTFTNKTLTQPTIGDFTNATHGHTNAAGGGSLDAAAIGSGALAKARQHAATVYNDQSNTYSTGDQDFSAASSVTAPVAAGAAPTANGRLAYDSTANDLEYGDNGTNRKVANLDEAQTFTNKTLTQPTIGDFTNATHGHTNAAGGGQLGTSALTDGAVTTAKAAASLKTVTKSLAIFEPTTTDSGRVQIQLPTASTITRVSCAVKAATSVTVNLNKRSEATPDTGGTDVLSAGLVCDTNAQTSCSSGCDVNTITSAGVSARQLVALTISATSGTPDTLRLHVEYTID
jgi:hypothetical protein